MKRAIAPVIVFLWSITIGNTRDFYIDMTGNDAIDGYQYNEPRTIIYVMGIADGLFSANGKLQVSKERQIYCGPPSLDTGQVFGILSGFIARFPIAGQLHVGNALVEAFAEAFPCAYDRPSTQ